MLYCIYTWKEITESCNGTLKYCTQHAKMTVKMKVCMQWEFIWSGINRLLAMHEEWSNSMTRKGGHNHAYIHTFEMVCINLFSQVTV